MLEPDVSVISKPTVFVLGAGASIPYGLPSGEALLKLSVNAGKNAEIVGFLREITAESKEAIGHFCKDLDDCQLPSVDAFLEIRQEYTGIGKAFMARLLIPLEKGANLQRTGYADHLGPMGRWYDFLWSEMRAPTPELFKHNMVKVVTFNYDRSLEAFIFGAIRATYGVDEVEAMALLGSIEVVHVHGQLQPFGPNIIGRRNFEPSITLQIVRAAANHLKLIHEAGTGDRFERAKDILSRASRIYVIGFGYHEENIKRLSFQSTMHDKPFSLKPRIYTNMFGLGSGEIERARERMRNNWKMQGHPIQLYPNPPAPCDPRMTGLGLLKEYPPA